VVGIAAAQAPGTDADVINAAKARIGSGWKARAVEMRSVMAVLGSGIPLTLLIDLTNRGAVDSRAIAASEGGNALWLPVPIPAPRRPSPYSQATVATPAERELVAVPSCLKIPS